MQEEARDTPQPTTRPVHENLDTAYVNLAALLTYLRGREFTGRIHVELDEYEADVFLNAAGQRRVRERDHLTGREGEGEDALQRLLVRSLQPGGLVSVYEHSSEEMSAEVSDTTQQDAVAAPSEDAETTDEEREWNDLLRLSGELIATVERAVLSAGADFASLLLSARLSLADDYSFLDPSAGRFDYANGVVSLRTQPNPKAFVSSICEAMRRVVDRIAVGPRRAGIRERVALELAVFARRRQSHLAKFNFTPQLDRIAGTRVL